MGSINFSLVAVLLAVGAITGCASAPALITKNDSKYVTVSRPLIFSKETMVIARKKELDWLHEQLDAQPEFGLQGARYTREFSSTQVSASIQADPTQIANYKARQQVALDDLDRATELAEIKQSSFISNETLNQDRNLAEARVYQDYLDETTKRIVESTRLSNLLVEQQNELVLSACAKDKLNIELPDSPTPDQVTEAETQEDANRTACDDARKAYITAVTALNDKLPSLADLKTTFAKAGSQVVPQVDAEGNPVPGPSISGPSSNAAAEKALVTANANAAALKALKASTSVVKNPANASEQSVTPIQSFEDKLSYRNRVQDQISKIQLDDRHDTMGNSLYRMQFNVGVIPQRNNAHWAKVDVEMYPTESTLLPPEFFKTISLLAYREKELQNAIFRSSAALAKAESRPTIDSAKDKDGAKEQADEIANLTAVHKQTVTDHDYALLSIKKYHGKNQKYAARSVTSYSDQWLYEMSAEVQTRFRHILKDLLSNDTDPALYSRANRILYFFCRSVSVTGSDPLLGACPTRGSAPNVAAYRGDNTGRPVTISSLSEMRRMRTELNDENGVHNLTEYNRTKSLELINTLFFRAALKVAEDQIETEYDIHRYNSIGPTKNTITGVSSMDPTALSRLIYLGWRNRTNPTTKKNYEAGKWQLIADLHSKQIADVYAVTPIESAQRIEDIAESSKTFGANVGVGFLAGSVGGEAAVSYIKGKEKLLSTLLRKPVILGLPGSTIKPKLDCDKPEEKCELAGIKFSWLIGPIFQIKDDRQNAEFFHEATVKTVAADVSLPSWWKSVRMNAKATWIKRGSLRDISFGSVDVATVDDPIYLPAKATDLPKIFRSTPRPTIRLDDDNPEKNTHVTGGERFNIIIEGKDIWRVSSASIGGVLSDEVQILGDMDAIRVTFPKVTSRACVSKLSGTGEKTSCETNIKLWSRNADAIDYDRTALISWTKEVPKTQTADSIKLKQVVPQILGFVDSSVVPVKLILSGLEDFEAAQLLVQIGDQSFTPVVAKLQRDGTHEIVVKLNPSEAWPPRCKVFKEVATGFACVLKADVLYKGKYIQNNQTIKLRKKETPTAAPAKPKAA